MRVTLQQKTSHINTSIVKLSEQMLRAQNKISSGKKVSKPSDDPIAAAKILDHRTSLQTMEQYVTNVETAKSRVEYADAILGYIDDLVTEAHGIAQAQSSRDAESMAAAAIEVRDIYDHIMELANSKYGDHYIFSGSKSHTPPFTRDADFNATYQGNGDSYQTMVSDSQVVKVVSDGEAIFQDPPDGTDLFLSLKALIDGLEAGDNSQVLAQTENLHNAQIHNHSVRTQYGTNLHRLEVSGNHWQNFRPKVEEMLTRLEAADMAEAIIELNNLEIAYQATIMTAAKIVQPSLIQFLG